MQKTHKYLIPSLTISLIVIFILITIFNLFYRTKIDTGLIIARDVAALASIFKRIDETCDIIEVSPAASPINFLTVKKHGFVGSEIGSLNLSKPEQWEGPYVQNTPEVQGIEYQMVKIKQGIFVLPGNGVVLPNGKKIGKEIIIEQQTDLLLLMQQEEGLRYQEKELAARVDIKPHLFEMITADELAHAQEQWMEQEKGAVQVALK